MGWRHLYYSKTWLPSVTFFLEINISLSRFPCTIFYASTANRSLNRRRIIVVVVLLSFIQNTLFTTTTATSTKSTHSFKTDAVISMIPAKKKSSEIAFSFRVSRFLTRKLYRTFRHHHWPPSRSHYRLWPQLACSDCLMSSLHLHLDTNCPILPIYSRHSQPLYL